MNSLQISDQKNQFTQYNEIKDVLDAICPILESWVIFELIDETKCEYLLAEQGLSNDDIDLVMELVNFKGIESKGIYTQLSEYIQNIEEENAGWSTDCGHDLWLGSR
jgi:hypothetical protein